MKKLISLLCTLALFVCALSLVGCKENTVVIDGDYVAITVDAQNVEEGATLREYMDYLQSRDELTYEIKDGMLISINGKKGNSNTYWMLYTSDSTHANDEWGTCIFQEKTYGSATLGANELPVKDGCLYIWYLQSF